MEKFRAIQKGIFTSLVGLVIIGILVHQYLQTGEYNQTDLIQGLFAVGLLFAKDQFASHTK